MFGAGLRGAVALALVMQMPSSSQDQIVSGTLFIIFWSVTHSFASPVEQRRRDINFVCPKSDAVKVTQTMLVAAGQMWCWAA